MGTRKLKLYELVIVRICKWIELGPAEVHVILVIIPCVRITDLFCYCSVRASMPLCDEIIHDGSYTNTLTWVGNCERIQVKRRSGVMISDISKYSMPVGSAASSGELHAPFAVRREWLGYFFAHRI